MATNQDQIPILQQMLRSAHPVVMDSIDAITEPEIRQASAPDEWTVAQLMSHIAEIKYFWMEKEVLITKESDPNITRSDVENDRRAAAVIDRAGDSLEKHIWSLAAANEPAVATTGEDLPREPDHPWPQGREQPHHCRGSGQIFGHSHGRTRPPDHRIPAADQPALSDLNQPMGLCYPFGYETKISSRYICCCDTIGRLRVGNTKPDCRTD